MNEEAQGIQALRFFRVRRMLDETAIQGWVFASKMIVSVKFSPST